MTCIAPEEIQQGDLVAYIEGSASQQVREHVAHCAFCAGEVEALGRIDQILGAALYRESCPTAETLFQFQTGLLPARERRPIQGHLQTCPHCARELEQITALDAPQCSLWAEMRQQARAVVEAVSLAPPPHLATALRGGRFSPRLYRAGELDIVLGSEILPASRDLWRLRGRVTQGGLPVARLTDSAVRLVQRDHIVARQTVDDLGYLSFDPLAAGQYSLWLEGPETDVVVHEVIVGTTERSET